MDLAARIGIVEEFYQSRSRHSQQPVISQVPLLRPGVLAEKEEWANFTSNQASDRQHRGTQLCVDFLDPMQIEPPKHGLMVGVVFLTMDFLSFSYTVSVVFFQFVAQSHLMP